MADEERVITVVQIANAEQKTARTRERRKKSFIVVTEPGS